MIKYLAIPYTHKNEEVLNLRFEIANLISAELMKKGDVIFSPISHTHPMAKYGLPIEWSYWKSQDEKFLDVCEKLYVTLLKGWDKSTGVNAEITHMKSRNVDVTYLDPYELGNEVLNKMVEKHNALVG